MIVSQARCLRDRGDDVSICCAKFGRGGAEGLGDIRRRTLPKPLNLMLSSQMRDRAYQALASRTRRTTNSILIDHGQSFADAEIAYVHNFLAPQFAARACGYLANERIPWTDASRDTTLIANSRMVRQALIDVLGLPESNIIVQYPGYDSTRFNLENRGVHRAATRDELGISKDEALVGLVTSGAFEKRGLDQFLECFNHLYKRHKNLRGLILGGRHRPRALATHRDYKAGRVVYRPVNSAPERYVAALDLVLYPAQYEEFGIVVLEAMAMGIPIVTSTAVGSAELLAHASERLVIVAGCDDSATYCERASEMLQLDESARVGLQTSLCRVAENHTQEAHNASLMTLVDQIIEAANPAHG